jgi:uncharacterized repeat protein (TIGR02543 family)
VCASDLDDQSNVEYGTELTWPVEPDEVKGYTFEGWTVTGIDEDTDVDEDGKFLMPDNNVEFIGNWNINTYDITYSYSGDLVPDGATDPKTLKDTGVEYGTQKIVVVAPTMEGYIFSGWVTTDAAVTDGKFNMPDSDVAFTGYWTVKTYALTIDIDPEESGEVIGADEYTKGEDVNITAKANPGYRFVKWILEEGEEDVELLSETATAATFIMPDHAVIITALFEVAKNNNTSGSGTTTYTVTFNTNGGSSVASKTVTASTKVAKPADPTKEEFIFAGWYTDAALTTAYNFDALVTKSFTLYAKWTDEEDDGEEEEEGNGFFTDVPESVWYYEDVKYVFEAGLMDGTGDNKFSPGISVTRAMLVTVLYRMEESPEVDEPASFSDVSAGTWYTDAVAWAEAEGIVEGYPDGTFKPNQNVSRQELATVLLRYAKFIGKDQISADPDDPVIEDDDDENADDETLDNLSGTEGFDDDLEFLDAARIGDWAKEGVAFCVKNGIIQGRPGNIFDPAASATRGELAAMLHRFLENI